MHLLRLFVLAAVAMILFWASVAEDGFIVSDPQPEPEETRLVMVEFKTIYIRDITLKTP